ncbi:hypothetical protein N644_2170 [Lactiplantibacillus paraplantarum]|nr:hypothetical protein N644_2170 [Lactiplantibacillus paraplantarum]
MNFGLSRCHHVADNGLQRSVDFQDAFSPIFSYFSMNGL